MIPTRLLGTKAGHVDAHGSGFYSVAYLLAVGGCVGCLLLSVPFRMQKKQHAAPPQAHTIVSQPFEELFEKTPDLALDLLKIPALTHQYKPFVASKVETPSVPQVQKQTYTTKTGDTVAGLLKQAGVTRKMERLLASVSKTVSLRTLPLNCPIKVWVLDGVATKMNLTVRGKRFQWVRVGSRYSVFFKKIAQQTEKKTEEDVGLLAALKTSQASKTQNLLKRVALPAFQARPFSQNIGKGAYAHVFALPLKKGSFKLSSKFGFRIDPWKKIRKMHKGLDFKAQIGTPIFASACGVVEKISKGHGFGTHVVIRHEGGFKTLYGHMCRHAHTLYEGMPIRQGTVIGFVGSTGHSTGPHLHLELTHHGKHLDPSRFLSGMCPAA